MGADLYAVGYNEHYEKVQPLFDAAVEKRNGISDRDSEEYIKAQEEVEKHYDEMHPDHLYFRDSYNRSSVLWRLGLSWWKDVETIDGDEETGEIQKTEDNPHGVNMTPALCIKFAEKVEAATFTPMTTEEAAAEGMQEVEEWNKHWLEKKEKLAKFMRSCAEKGGCNASL